jgi:hypothetical protein
LPGNLVDKYTALETENAQLRAELADCETENNYLRADLAETEAKLAALREQEPVRFERRSFRKGELFRDWHTSTASEVKSIGERKRFVNELGEEWIHETRKLYTAPKPAIPEGFVLVPVEPTWEMLVAADSMLKNKNGVFSMTDAYKAMLAAKENNNEN